MSDNYEPRVISRLPTGGYTWCCATSVDYLRIQLWTGFKLCAAVDLVILAIGPVLYLLAGAVELLIVFCLVALCFLALVVLIFGLTFLLYRDPHERYQLFDTYVMTGSGRSSSWFNFDKTRVLTIHRDYLELRGKVAVMRVYAPAEDFDFVRNYVLNRMPDETDIRYE